MKVGDLVTHADDTDATFWRPGLVVARHGRALLVLWPSRTSIHHEDFLKRVYSDGNDSAHNKKQEKLNKPVR